MEFGFRELIIVALLLYLLPFFIAVMRGHPQKLPIFVLNLLLGWTLAGWVAALVFSLWNFEKRAGTS